jgi:hypothetical protein
LVQVEYFTVLYTAALPYRGSRVQYRHYHRRAGTGRPHERGGEAFSLELFQHSELQAQGQAGALLTPQTVVLVVVPSSYAARL